MDPDRLDGPRYETPRPREGQVIDVPDVDAPDGKCWQQKLDPPHAMMRCGLPKGHAGGHSWDVADGL